DDLLAKGMHRDDAQREVVLRACRELGVQSAAVPPAFPLALADHLRAGGVELAPDRELFDGRRRAKTALEVAGIRRAQRAAEAGMRVAAGMLAAALPGPQGVLRLEGEPLTSERIRAAIDDAIAAHDAVSEGFIVAHGAQGAVGHDLGSGPIAAGEPTQRTKAAGEVLRDGFFHGLGHGVGLDVHEAPGLGRGPDVLQAGDVIAIEPGTYRRDRGGVRLEDLVLVTETGAELLTDFP